MLLAYKRSQTSVVFRVKILNSSVTTGAGLQGLTSASAGLVVGTIADNGATTAAYTQAGGTIETISTLGTYAAPTATKCRFKEVDATNHPGVYEIQLADARFAVASAKSLLVSISGATNCAETDALIPLLDLNPYDSVRAGLTALPAAAADAAGGLAISDAGGLDLDVALEKGMFADGTVYAEQGGTNSTTWPYGSAPYPTSTIANAKTIADANNIKQIHVQGNLSPGAAMEHYRFIGLGHIAATDLFDTNGQGVDHSTFKHMIVTGATGATAVAANQSRYVDCLLYAHTNINAVMIGGAMGSACSIRDTGYALLSDTFFGEVAACTLTLQAPSQCDIVDMRGTLTLAGMDGGVCSISMQPGALLTINNTCTAGTITVTGAGTVTDNSNGSTVTVQVAESDVQQLLGTALTEASGGQLSAAFKKLFDVASPLLVASDVMRGTNSANTTVPDAAGTANTLVGNLETHGDGSWATASGFNTVVPDATGVAAGLHGTTDGLIGGLVVPDAAGTSKTLVAAYDAAKTAAQLGDAMDLEADALDAAAVAASAVTKIAAGVSTSDIGWGVI